MRRYIGLLLHLLLLALAAYWAVAPPRAVGPPRAVSETTTAVPLSPQEPRTDRRVLPALGRGSASAVGFSPNGRWLAVGYDDGAVGLWRVEEGSLRWLAPGHRRWVTDVAFVKGGKTLVTGSGDGTVSTWDVASGKRRAALQSRHPILTLAITPDGRTVATGGGGNTVRLWDTTTGRLKRVVKGDAGPEARDHPPLISQVLDVAYSPDGRWLATVHSVIYPGEPMQSADYISVRSAVTGTLKHALCHLTEVIDRVTSIAFSPDSAFLIAGHDRSGAGGHIERWDLATGAHRTLASAVEPGCSSVQLALNGRAVAVIGMGEGPSLWDTATGRETHWLDLRPSTRSLAVTPNGKLAAIGVEDGSVTLWQLPTGAGSPAPRWDYLPLERLLR